MKRLTLIQARGGVRGLPGKNVVPVIVSGPVINIDDADDLERARRRCESDRPDCLPGMEPQKRKEVPSCLPVSRS